MAKIIVAKLELDALDCSNLLMAIDAYKDRHRRQLDNGKLEQIKLHDNMQRVQNKIKQALTNIQNAYDLKRSE